MHFKEVNGIKAIKMKFGFTKTIFLTMPSPTDPDRKRPLHLTELFSDENQRAIMDAFNSKEKVDTIVIYHKMDKVTESDAMDIRKFTINFQFREVNEISLGLTCNSFDLKVFA